MFMLSIRFPVSSKLFVVNSLGVESYTWIFNCTWVGLPKPHVVLFTGQLYLQMDEMIFPLFLALVCSPEETPEFGKSQEALLVCLKCPHLC